MPIKSHDFFSKNYAKDDLWLQKNRESSITHDKFFNNRKKSLYESELASIAIKHAGLFFPVLDKISALIYPDIVKTSKACQNAHGESVSAKIHRHFLQFEDFNLIFDRATMNDSGRFYKKITDCLKSTRTENFYMKLCIHRAFIIFFTEKGKAKPVLHQATKEKWSDTLDLKRLVQDTEKYRADLFRNNLRLNRPHLRPDQKISDRIGLTDAPTDDGAIRLPRHRKGILQFFITTEGNFTRSGMHEYDMPQACGPSGMIAMRLAIAEQANLSPQEKKLYDFAVSLYTVGIGAHTIDECFSVGTSGQYSQYCRGDYTSIVPDIIKNDRIFSALWDDIQALNLKFSLGCSAARR